MQFVHGAVLAGLAIGRSDDLGAISALKGEPQEVMQLAIGRPIDLVRYPLATGTEAIGPTLPMMNPYQGLRSFTAATRQFFFGRDRTCRSATMERLEHCWRINDDTST